MNLLGNFSKLSKGDLAVLAKESVPCSETAHRNCQLHLSALVICWYSFFEAKEIKICRKHQHGATSALIWQHVIQQSSAKNKKTVKQAKGSTWYSLMPEAEAEAEPSQQHGRCEGMEKEGHAGTNGMSWLNQTQPQPSALEGING